MFKTIYTFGMTGEQFEDWNDCEKAVREWAENHDDEYAEWVDNNYDPVEIGDFYYSAWDVLERFGEVDAALDNYVDALMESDVDEGDVEVGYVFRGEKFDTLADAEAAAVDFAVETYDNHIAMTEGTVTIMGAVFTIKSLLYSYAEGGKEIYYSKMPAYMDECKLMIDEFTEEDED